MSEPPYCTACHKEKELICCKICYQSSIIDRFQVENELQDFKAGKELKEIREMLVAILDNLKIINKWDF